MRNYEGTTVLQGLGEVQGIQAKNLQVGDFQVWNYGSSSEIINIETTKSGKTLIITYRWFNKHARVENEKWIGEWQEQIRKFRATTIVVVKELNPVQEVSEVKQIKKETEELLSYMDITTLETQKESLELISQQLDKVNKAIENNIDNEEIRLQLRDIENNLKYNYSGLYEMIEEQEKADKQESKIKVTHNEYEKICKELASRIYAKDETKITYKQYEEMLDNYDILPFEINTDNEELKKIINTYADNEEIEADRTIYRGSIAKSVLYDLYQNKGYKDLYYEYYQVIICKDELKTILTYCEGDFIAEVYNTIGDYNKGIERTKNFIEEM